ncbi:hypothetical protein THAOC_19412, partial [Thalassiosira oceanica]
MTNSGVLFRMACSVSTWDYILAGWAYIAWAGQCGSRLASRSVLQTPAGTSSLGTPNRGSASRGEPGYLRKIRRVRTTEEGFKLLQVNRRRKSDPKGGGRMGVGTRILVCLFLMSIAVRVANRESASEPPSLDATDRKPLCGREDLRRGKWAERTIGNATGHRWEAASAGAVPCRYHADFDRAAFCELMANVVVMFVGDSLMWEMYASMVRLTDDNNLALSKRVHLR